MILFYANVFVTMIYCWNYTCLFHAGIIKTEWSVSYKYNIPELQTILMKATYKCDLEKGKYNVKTEFYLPKDMVVMYQKGKDIFDNRIEDAYVLNKEHFINKKYEYTLESTYAIYLYVNKSTLVKNGFENDFVLNTFSENEMFLELADFKIKFNVKNGEITMATSNTQEYYDVSVFNMNGTKIDGINFIEEDLQDLISKMPLCFVNNIAEFADSKDMFTNGNIEIDFKLVNSFDIYNNWIRNRFSFHKDELITRKMLLNNLKEKETPEPKKKDGQEKDKDGQGSQTKDGQGSQTKTVSGVKTEETPKPKDKTSDSSSESTFKIDWWVWLITAFTIFIIVVLVFVLIRNYLVKRKEAARKKLNQIKNDENLIISKVELI